MSARKPLRRERHPALLCEPAHHAQPGLLQRQMKRCFLMFDNARQNQGAVRCQAPDNGMHHLDKWSEIDIGDYHGKYHTAHNFP